MVAGQFVANDAGHLTVGNLDWGALPSATATLLVGIRDFDHRHSKCTLQRHKMATDHDTVINTSYQSLR